MNTNKNKELNKEYFKKKTTSQAVIDTIITVLLLFGIFGYVLILAAS